VRDRRVVARLLQVNGAAFRCVVAARLAQNGVKRSPQALVSDSRVRGGKLSRRNVLKSLDRVL
jgi:hypothetical protein